MLFIGLMINHRDEIDRVQRVLNDQDHDVASPHFGSAEEVVERFSMSGKRASIVTSVREHLVWIVEQFEQFRPGQWYMGVFFLVLRMVQTSVLVLVPKQNLQAAAGSVIAIIGAFLLREAEPFRRSSDNETAVLSQYCIFCWCFAVVLRDMKDDPIVLLAIGIVLIVATFAVFAHAFWRVRLDCEPLHRPMVIEELAGDDGDDDALGLDVARRFGVFPPAHDRDDDALCLATARVEAKEQNRKRLKGRKPEPTQARAISPEDETDISSPKECGIGVEVADVPAELLYPQEIHST